MRYAAISTEASTFAIVHISEGSVIIHYLRTKILGFQLKHNTDKHPKISHNYVGFSMKPAPGGFETTLVGKIVFIS
jgi:hypothetical protein